MLTRFPGEEVTAYEVIADQPSNSGAANETVAVYESTATTDVMLGAPGTV